MARINIPPLTRSLLLSLVAFTLLNAVIQPQYTIWSPLSRTGHGAPYISIVPGTSYRYPWTFATASFVEQNVFGLLGTGLTLFYGGRYLERAWSSNDFLKFILFIGVIPNLLCFALYISFYLLSSSSKALTTTISGGISIQAGFLVAFKQLVPEHTVSILRGLIRMRVKHFPALFLLLNTISGVLFGTETAMFLAYFAFLTSWTYLRFFRISHLLTSASTGGDASMVRGDASDTFAFACFFPDPLAGPVAVIADKIYDILIAIRVCTPFSYEDVESGNEQAIARAEGGLPNVMSSRGGSGRREEAERRRALALKALDQRLNASSSRGPIQGPGATAPVPFTKEDHNSTVVQPKKSASEANS